MFLAAGIVMIFATLHIFRFEPTALLAGGGIVSIVMGLAVSTFVGNILAGTLVLMTHPFKEGDTVMINNIPGRVIEMSALVTRIRNDVGGEIVIPNTAIAQGTVIVTKIPPNATVSQTGLPYSLGDKVYTTYMNEEGVVKELSPFYPKILLNSGKEFTRLNTSIITGAVAVAKISSAVNEANQPR